MDNKGETKGATNGDHLIGLLRRFRDAQILEGLKSEELKAKTSYLEVINFILADEDRVVSMLGIFTTMYLMDKKFKVIFDEMVAMTQVQALIKMIRNQ